MKCRSFTRSSTREYTTLRIFSVITLSILYQGSLSLQTALARENILSRSRECSLLQSRKCTICGSPSSSPAKHFARTFWFAVVWFILCSAFLKFSTQPSGFENLKQSTLFCFSEQHKCFKTLLYQDTTANTFKNTNIPLSTVNCLSRLSWQTGSIIGHPRARTVILQNVWWKMLHICRLYTSEIWAFLHLECVFNVCMCIWMALENKYFSLVSFCTSNFTSLPFPYTTNDRSSFTVSNVFTPIWLPLLSTVPTLYSEVKQTYRRVNLYPKQSLQCGQISVAALDPTDAFSDFEATSLESSTGITVLTFCWLHWE